MPAKLIDLPEDVHQALRALPASSLRAATVAVLRLGLTAIQKLSAKQLAAALAAEKRRPGRPPPTPQVIARRLYYRSRAGGVPPNVVQAHLERRPPPNVDLTTWKAAVAEIMSEERAGR